MTHTQTLRSMLDDDLYRFNFSDEEEAAIRWAIDTMPDLLRRAYLAMHRAQWQDGETDAELCAAINDSMDDEWRASVDASKPALTPPSTVD